MRRSRITVNYKVSHLGYFNDEYDAHLAYQKAAKEVNEAVADRLAREK